MNAGQGVASTSTSRSTLSNQRFFRVDAILLLESALVELDGEMARQLLDAILHFLGATLGF